MLEVLKKQQLIKFTNEKLSKNVATVYKNGFYVWPYNNAVVAHWVCVSRSSTCVKGSDCFFMPAVTELFKDATLIHSPKIITAAVVLIDCCICPPVLVILLLYLLHWAKEMFAHTACLGCYFCSCLRSHIELAVITFLLCLRQVLLSRCFRQITVTSTHKLLCII